MLKRGMEETERRAGRGNFERRAERGNFGSITAAPSTTKQTPAIKTLKVKVKN